ncbi:Tim44 domain-containing protein [Azotobacter bryophylli]|uniref:Tim44 domain-containing protein n=1 Tax=Azotobacter bryophylli TaxID=1986537 RepID=A0ABV7AUM0_9GAMM
MQRFLSLALAFCVALTLSLDVNAAKRFGGGKSFGSAPTHQTTQTRQAPQQQPNSVGAAPAPAPGASTTTRPATQPQANPAAAPVRPASGASRWLGPLAGIAAGGLLASMFMGDGFQGFQLLDFLIIALIAFLVFRFVVARRHKQQPAMAGHAPMPQGRAMPGAPLQRQAPAAPNAVGGSRATARPVLNAPAWFNEQRFLAAAQEHFMALQQHWDANEMDKIAEFVTPQMLSFLKQERDGLGDGYQSTYIDDLHVQLDGIDDLADKTVATLTFSGVSKSSRFDQGEPFSESWRMERRQGQNQPWLLAGIRQNG